LLPIDRGIYLHLKYFTVLVDSVKNYIKNHFQKDFQPSLLLFSKAFYSCC
jgi:hypothetical protein